MRFLLIAIAAMLLMAPVAAPANAGSAAKHSVQVAATDYSAAKKKTIKKEKVEYMRAAPMK